MTNHPVHSQKEIWRGADDMTHRRDEMDNVTSELDTEDGQTV